MQSLTLSYMGTDWCLRASSLGVTAVPHGVRTGAAIAAAAVRTLEKFGLRRAGCTLVGTTADGCPAEQLGGHTLLGESAAASVVCCAHTINLAVQAGWATPQMAPIMAKVFDMSVVVRLIARLGAQNRCDDSQEQEAPLRNGAAVRPGAHW